LTKRSRVGVDHDFHFSNYRGTRGYQPRLFQ
jgi:hypothetical protein